MPAIAPSTVEPTFLARLKRSGMRQPFALAPLLLPTLAASAAEHFRYDSSYQVYDESAGRIKVESWYFHADMNLSEDTVFKFQLLRDAISGASPTGALPGGVQPFLADLEDVRNGVLAALSQQVGDHRVELELSRSLEQDYLSYGVSLSDHWELNQKNTTLSLGLNYLDDSVKVFGLPDQSKHSYDIFVGISQLLDKNTILSANLTVGYAEGYLNDPYKAIQRTDTVIIGGIPFPVVNLYRENRPSSRLREVLQLQGTRFFETLRGALDSTIRLSADDYGVFSQTLQIEWRQAIGDKLEVTPYFRYYRQNAADFFRNTLDGVPIGTPPTYPDGSGPNYSADYRLSSLSSLSVGLKARYRVTENIALSTAFEHYDMSGSGSNQAPAEAYPTASIWTFGVTIEF
ncbi:MAG: DUF3570 domain-containing protein [Prosthecobacter sp.]|nr:DUF3570 domain-containing protein [Prosthecobacter sp.]